MSRIIVGSPVAGWVTPIDMVPDPVFAEHMLGDGIAIDPTEALFRAPLAGRIATLHPARHAVTIETDAGPVLLLHVGLETVALGGDGFEAYVSEGARVAAGDPLIGFDIERVGAVARSLVTPVVVTNGDAFRLVPIAGEALVDAGTPLFELVAVSSAENAQDAQGPAVERSLRIPLAHGLHARPAARLAQVAREHAASLEIIAQDGRRAALGSPVALLALALPHGATIRVTGRGADAHTAVNAIADLIQSGMGEARSLEPDAVHATNAVAGVEEAVCAAPSPLPDSLRGVKAAPGFAMGPAWRMPDLLDFAEHADDPSAERMALSAALDRVRTDLQGSAAGSGDAASIAAAHLAFLDDSELLAAAERHIADGHSASFAWKASIDRFIALLGATGDLRFAERTDDLRDLSGQVLIALQGGGAVWTPPPGAILAATDVLPSHLLGLADKGLAGIAAGHGGPTSHTAIIAASMGLPMVAALGPDIERIAPGTPLMLDADDGTLLIDPSETERRQRQESAAREAAFRVAAKARTTEAALTRDGHPIEVFANIGSVADARTAAANGAEGCGLLRTEFVFLDRPTPPDEEEQFGLYQAIADALGGRPLIARTLDIGADKPAPWLPMPAEENPALGVRGIRLCLQRPALLRTQLRALLRVDGDVRIMLPMIIALDELQAARAVLIEEARSLGRPVPDLGVMVETPSAALLADSLAREADFFSIGSNDLSQYALAMDRGNPAVAAQLDALHPTVLRLISAAVQGGAAAGRWTGVCGGMAAERAAVPVLIGLGVTELSVPPGEIAVIKATVRDYSLEECRALARRALAADGPAQVRALVAEILQEDAA
jgi:multiphosphoryl transfer protein